jgi:hypothetical protein
MTKHICPNCDIELDLQYQSSITDKGEQMYKPMWICGICSYGWFIDWKED